MVDLPQLAAHVLERLLQVAEFVAAPHFHRAGVVALADALGAPDERGHRALQLAHRAPRQYPGDARAEAGERQTQSHVKRSRAALAASRRPPTETAATGAACSSTSVRFASVAGVAAPGMFST